MPHRTASSIGTARQNLSLDDILRTTKVTLVELSKSSAIAQIIEALIALLETIAQPYAAVTTHPSLVLLSEVYVLNLVADCCSANWIWASEHSLVESDDPVEESEWTAHAQQRDSAQTTTYPKSNPSPLEESLVNRSFDVLKNLLEPLPENYPLPAQSLLDEVSRRNLAVPRSPASPEGEDDDTSNGAENFNLHMAQVDLHAKRIVEYLTASSWSFAFEYFKDVVYSARTTTTSTPGPDPALASLDAERAALVVLRLLSFFWVDSQKLGLIIQELCSSFLHLRRPFQSTVSIVTPLLIIRWIDRFPDQFIQLHLNHRRLDGGADTLFHMTQTVTDNPRRKAALYPLQITLLYLLPDLFEVASNLIEARGNSVTRKVTFLDGLRKALRNGNEQAGYCFVSLLRVARHFGVGSDSAIVSYAMDVQDEVRDAVFRPSTLAAQSAFDQTLITAAFVSLVHLNIDSSASLVRECLLPTAKDSYRIAVAQACRYFADLSDSNDYQDLIELAVPYMKQEIDVRLNAKSAPSTRLTHDRVELPHQILVREQLRQMIPSLFAVFLSLFKLVLDI